MLSIAGMTRATGGFLILALWSGPALAGPLLTDPTGDTFGTGPFRPDITTYSAITDPRPPLLAPPNTTFTVNFAAAISPPSAGRPSTLAAPSVVGFIDIDADQNRATGGSAPWGGPVPGGNSWINFFVNGGTVPGPPIALGDEFYVDIGSEEFNPGFVDILRTSDNTVVTTVPITFTPTSFTLSVPLSALADDGRFNFGLVLGNFASPTDRAPNGAVPAESFVIPEPHGLLLFATGIFSLLGWRWRRRGATPKLSSDIGRPPSVTIG